MTIRETINLLRRLERKTGNVNLSYWVEGRDWKANMQLRPDYAQYKDDKLRGVMRPSGDVELQLVDPPKA